MRIEEIIYKLLSEDSNISNIIQDKIYPLRAAQGKSNPFVTYTIKNATPNSGKKELSSFDSYLIDIDIFSDSFSEVNQLSYLIRSKFEAFTFNEDGTFCDFDFLTYGESYGNDSQMYNKTVSIIGHYVL